MKRAWVLWLGAASAACRSVPEARVGVASVDIRGNHALSSSDLRDRIATQTTPKILGVFRSRWQIEQPLEPTVLQADLERIEHYYRRRGYYEVRVRAGRIVPAAHGWADVDISVTEGTPVRVRSLHFEGLHGAPPAVGARVRGAVLLGLGDSFDEEPFEESARSMAVVLTDGGFAYAHVEPVATVDLGPKAADVIYRVDLGPRCRIGPISFEGFADLPEAPLRRVFGVESGQPYATDDLEAGRRALLDLGVFASADVVPDLSNRDRTDVPIRVSLKRSSLHGLRAGGGLLIDLTRADVHGVFSWEHRNLFGGMRRFLLEERPSVVFFPTALPALHAPSRLLPANSLAATFQQPSFPEARTFTRVRAEYNRYPVILPPLDPNQAVMPGYNEVRLVVGPERAYNLIHVRTAATYNLQANFPFTYFGDRNPAFRRVIASFVGLRADFDVRDDPVDSTRGFFLSAAVEYAGGPLGGDASDVRFRPELRMYFPLGAGVVLAGRGTLGFLFPRNYGRLIGADFLSLPNVDPPGSQAGVPGYIRDLQLTYFRGFFSGGSDSNRGYGFREIGPHGVNPAIIPGTVEEEKARCTPGNPNYDENLCFVPSGGLSLWEASIELRTPVVGNLGGALFVDASDVSPSTLTLRLYVPHLSAGFGIRYATPVGPLRVDLGFRIPGAQRLGAPLDPATDGPEPTRLFGFLPAALSLGLGQAY